ncbi:RNA polymerase sigma factor SigJ [Actinomadura sp. KC06]|uniref:RNA polymerase sigma factor SigJ n=1 Tax=Actinomadura sp. KC06 TaxID=2530369 RepID=UPI001FB78023|nr:RNA polymerase sigma factor SigJ [Actinomadura sp. KC06]
MTAGTGGGPVGDELAQAFEMERPRLVRVAYATLGSLAEAEDCVQEAWLRLRGLDDPGEIRDLPAWLIRTVGRLALDALGSARARRERYVGTWLPEPLVGDAAPTADPADRVTMDEQVSMAMLVVMESLSPAERTAFLLHDVFGLPFDEVAEVVGRSTVAVRQLASRARRHVAEGRPRFPPAPHEQRALVTAFLSACQNGDLDGLMDVLAPEVVLRGDGGGKVSTVPRVLRGADEVAAAMLAFSGAPISGLRVTTVNGSPGIVARGIDGNLSVAAITVDAGRIVAIDVVRNPDKLTTVQEPDAG